VSTDQESTVEELFWAAVPIAAPTTAIFGSYAVLGFEIAVLVGLTMIVMTNIHLQDY